MPAKLCSKSFKARLHQYMNQELPDAKASCYKEAEVTEIKLQTFFGPWRNQESLTKTSNPSLTKAFYCVNHKSCGKFLKWWQYNTTLPVSWETCKSQEATGRTSHGIIGSKMGKEYEKCCILSPCLFNLYVNYIMWNVRLDESQAGIKITRRNINNLRYADDTTLMILILRKIEDKTKRGWQRIWWLESITDSNNMNFNKVWLIV